jgi:hypothetical protein
LISKFDIEIKKRMTVLRNPAALDRQKEKEEQSKESTQEPENSQTGKTGREREFLTLMLTFC